MISALQPLLAANAAVFAIKNATTEGQITCCVLLLLSMFSWTIIITKFRQLWIARRAAKKFFTAYTSTRDPLDIKKRAEEFPGAPAWELYDRGAEELLYQLKNNPVEVKTVVIHSTGEGNTDHMSRAITTKISTGSFEAVKVVLEEAASAQAMSHRFVRRPSTRRTACPPSRRRTGTNGAAPPRRSGAKTGSRSRSGLRSSSSRSRTRSAPTFSAGS